MSPPASADPDPRRRLPAVDGVLASAGVASLVADHGYALVRAVLRDELTARRAAGDGPDGLIPALAAALRPSVRPVINATGVLLNTNLGRAPLAAPARAAMMAAAGYTTLEWDPATGARGARDDHVAALLRRLTGAEAAALANTNAGAVLLALLAIAGGGQAIVSRGQLVEIGGGFRVPDIMAASGCELVEVGTTNRTRIDDYAAAIGPATRAILRVHPSNFRMTGFVAEVSVADLVSLAHQREIAVIDDLGSGALAADPAYAGEPDAAASVAAGADVVCFSADKLLGGPQAGVMVGGEEAIGRIRRHPLARALRLDKFRLAALEATLRLHVDRPRAAERIPTLRVLAESADCRRARADALAGALAAPVVATSGRVGGGALPEHELPSFAVTIDHPSPERLAAALRLGDPAVASRLHDGRLLLDVLALDGADIERLAALVPIAIDAAATY